MSKHIDLIRIENDIQPLIGKLKLELENFKAAYTTTKEFKKQGFPGYPQQYEDHPNVESQTEQFKLIQADKQIVHAKRKIDEIQPTWQYGALRFRTDSRRDDICR